MDILIVDASGIMFKNFITLQNFSAVVNGDRIGTGVFYGTIKTLIKVNEELKKKFAFYPDKIIFAFDRGNKRRQEIDPNYKKKRKEDRKESDFDYEEYIEQVKLTEEYLPMMGIDTVFSWGDEADDVINTLCERYKKDDNQIIVLSNDHDMYQVIDENVHLYQDKKNGGLLDIENFTDFKGIHPKRWTEVMSLTGCNTDEVEGIYRVGDSVAVKLINKMDDIVDKILEDKKEEFLEEFDWTENKKNKVLEYWDTVKLANKLVQLYEIPEEELEYKEGKQNLALFRSVLNRYNMGSLLKDENWLKIENLFGEEVEIELEEEDEGWDF